MELPVGDAPITCVRISSPTPSTAQEIGVSPMLRQRGDLS